MKGYPDPLNVPETISPPPPGLTPQRWARLVAACRALDARANHGIQDPTVPPAVEAARRSSKPPAMTGARQFRKEAR